ncbi:MAG: sugar phosphate isomerase/epimerase [Clostridia bacterium]|nr:sugar phosphate isomerase/epimerase [Clostridia bacterium]
MNNEYGIQLYSIRDLSSQNLDAALAAVSRIGYKYVEFAGFFGHTADEVLTMLRKYGLEVAGSHVSWGEFTPEKIDAMIEYHRAIGCKSVVIPAFDNKEESLEKLICYINSAEEKLKALGMSVAYHNHSVEFIRTDYGKVIFDEIVNRTNALIQLDVFWAYNAGMDPLEIIEKYSRRIKTIHLKDGIAAKESESGKPEGRYVGSGNVAIKDIIKLASKKGILMIVESEDLKPSGEMEITACMDYLRREG